MSDFNNWGWDIEEEPRGKKGRKVKATPTYDEWLAYGRKMAERHSGYQWRIGDWLVVGQELFDPNAVMGNIPGFMKLAAVTKDDGSDGFRASKTVKFWDEIEEAIGLATSTLKQYAQVARAYPRKQRLNGLGWSHHLVVCNYERRWEYLKACLNVPEGTRPRSISWLCKLVAREEGEERADRGDNFVRIPVDEDSYAKLKDLAKYYGTDLAEIVSVPFRAALEVFLDEQKKKYRLTSSELTNHAVHTVAGRSIES